MGEVPRHLNSLGLSWGGNPAWRFGHSIVSAIFLPGNASRRRDTGCRASPNNYFENCTCALAAASVLVDLCSRRYRAVDADARAFLVKMAC